MLSDAQNTGREATIRLRSAKLGIALAIALSFVATLPAFAHATDYLKRSGESLSLNFHDAPLKVVLERLQRDAQITVSVPPSLLDRKVTINITDTKIDPALETLFKSAALNNFAIVHEPGPKERIRVVLVEDGKGGATVRQAATEPSVETGVREGTPFTPEMRAMMTPPPAVPNDASVPDPNAPVQLVNGNGDMAPGQAPLPPFVPAATQPGPPPGADLPHSPPSGIPGVEGQPITPEVRHMLSVPGASAQ
jgi:hypothetical protein